MRRNSVYKTVGVESNWAVTLKLNGTRSQTLDRSLCGKQQIRSSKCKLDKTSPKLKSANNCESYSTGKDELLETAMRLHDVAMNDEYFIKRKLAPNVDFWCVSLSLFLIALSHHHRRFTGGTQI